MFGNRGIYYKGWSAVTRHSTPWVIDQAPVSFDEDVWELYDASTDGTQARDLSAEHPEKLRELQRLWLMEAVKYNVLPLDDRRMERLNPTLAGRPVLAKGPTQTLLPGMKRLSEHAVLDTKNRSYSVTAAVDSGDKPMQGVIIAQGGGFGGWAFYALEGRLVFTYNLLGIKHFDIPSDSVIDPGAHQVRAEFTYDGGGLGKGGMLSLFCDGEAVGSGRIDATQPVLFSADETTDIGDDVGLPVSKSYVGDSKFNGKIEFVQIDVGDDDHSHLVDQDTLVQVAMARQ
jgi:arylsulfatase